MRIVTFSSKVATGVQAMWYVPWPLTALGVTLAQCSEICYFTGVNTLFLQGDEKMKKLLVGLCLLMLSSYVFAEMSKAELQEMYLEYFRSRGIPAHIDGDGDIEFSYEGEYFNTMTFWIIVDETDQQHFQIIKSSLYSLDTEAQRARAPIAASNATRWANVAKIYVQSNGNNVSAIAGAFIVNPRDFRAIFVRLMQEMDIAMYRFLDEMRR